MLSFFESSYPSTEYKTIDYIAIIYNGVYRRSVNIRECRSQGSILESRVSKLRSSAIEDRYCVSYEHRNTLQA